MGMDRYLERAIAQESDKRLVEDDGAIEAIVTQAGWKRLSEEYCGGIFGTKKKKARRVVAGIFCVWGLARSCPGNHCAPDGGKLFAKFRGRNQFLGRGWG